MISKDAIVVLTADQLKGIIAEAVEGGVDAALAKVRAAEDSDVLDTEAAANLVGVTVRTLPRLVEEDGMPELRRIGNQRRFSRRQVLAWMAEHPKKRSA